MQLPVPAAAASLVALAALLILALRVLNSVWLRPKRLERFLRKQGITGTPYTLLVGDMRRVVSMAKEATAKPIRLTHDISPRVEPFLLQTVKNHGKTCYMWAGTSPRLIIMDAELIKDVMNKISNFPKPPIHPIVKLFASGIALYNGDKWAKHRKIINPAFHLERLKNMVPAFYRSCRDMISEWERLVPEKGSSCEVDVWPYLMNMARDVISRAAFGSSYDEGRRISQLQEEQGKLVLQAVWTLYIPGWRSVPTKTNKRIKEIYREVRSTLKEIIDKREKAMEAGQAAHEDLLGILLGSNSGQLQGNGMSIEDVIEECKLFYIAGQETTFVLLVWTMVVLSHHQDWQARAREEVVQVFGHKQPDFDGLNHLKIVTMILNEVLRLYTPAIPLIRVVPKETKLGNLTLPSGTEICVPLLLVHHDRTLWGEDATEFKPERFADGVSKATNNQVSFFPFGWGPRICIGQNFAMLEAKMALALILQSFSFELSPTYAHAPYTVITLRPQFGAHLILHKL